jgi:hypothetical protein
MNLSTFWTRKCRGCSDLSAHSHHLTLFGRFFFRFLAGGHRSAGAGE